MLLRKLRTREHVLADLSIDHLERHVSTAERFKGLFSVRTPPKRIFKGGASPMSEPRFKFSSLREILLDLGFKEVPVARPHIGFQHDASDLLIVLPSYRRNSSVASHHLVYVRMMLDGKGLMAAEAFDRLVANVPVGHSASS